MSDADDKDFAIRAPYIERIAELEQWKSEASHVMNSIDLQAIAKELGIAIGDSVGDKILPAVKRITELENKLAVEVEQIDVVYLKLQDANRQIADLERELSEARDSALEEAAAFCDEKRDVSGRLCAGQIRAMKVNK